MSILTSLFKKKKNDIDKNKIPQHIAIIMDGNGRWAKRRGLSRNIGHREGANTLKKVTQYCSEMGIKYLTVYAFSTENWKRPKNEVDALMNLLLDYLKNAERELAGNDTKIKVIGDRKALSKEIQSQIERVEKITRDNKGMTLNIALNYGSREEITYAVKQIAREIGQGRLKCEDIDDKLIASRLHTADTPDPDLLIRSSGEKRISNFLLWQSAYTEFWYTDVLWPDFKKEHLLEAIQEYQKRNRRFGGI